MATRRINLDTFSLSVREFARRDSDVRERYDLNPPYQRGRVWTVEQNQNLVYSMLAGIPIGAVCINRRPWQQSMACDSAVVDGQQRISAIRAFMDDETVVPALWFADDMGPRGEALMSYINETCGHIHHGGAIVEGVRFSGLNQNGRGLFTRCTIGVLEANLPTVEQEAELYLLLNFGGVAQTDDDRQRAEAVVKGMA